MLSVVVMMGADESEWERRARVQSCGGDEKRRLLSSFKGLSVQHDPFRPLTHSTINTPRIAIPFCVQCPISNAG